jgi:DAPG hydrolase PhiG domain
MELVDADQVVTASAWEDGYERLGPSRLFARAVDRLEGVTPEMIDWWFANMDRDLYLQFHPTDHKEFAWVDGKRPGFYVGATHLTHQLYDGQGPLMRAEISFIPPETIFDVGTFAEHDVGVVVCALIHFLDENDRRVPRDPGNLVHVGVRRAYGTELRTAWWLHVAPDADMDWQTTRRFRHCHEEFGRLAGFLPGLYAARRQKPEGEQAGRR